MSAMETDQKYLAFCGMPDTSFLIRSGRDLRRKQTEPKRIAVEPPPDETDSDKCRRHKEIQKRIKMMIGRLSFLEHCIRSEKEFPDLTDADALVKFQDEHDELSSQKEKKLGELALFLPCPVLDCPENAKFASKQNDPPESSAKKHSRSENRENNKTTKDDRGFVSLKKTVKKLKFSAPIAGTSQPVKVQNKFSSLSVKEAESNLTTSDQTAAPISARPRIPPIMFKYKKANYRSIIKNLNEDFPDCEAKLAGKYLKIFCKTSDEHRVVTDHLKEIKEQFYVIDPPDSRPLKVVIKGLPISTEINEIQDDLTSQGFSVEKVAQLTRSKTKAPLPIFMVELEKKPNSPDIFKLKKCCYLVVQVDAFNRRPGVSQCYNCNLFNHSSKNCFMHTRCLKCGESHRTNECPIKDKIQNPVCINCNKTGHMANWSQCEEFPKRKPRKGETTRNSNTSTESNKTSKKVTPALSFAAALSGTAKQKSTPGTPAATEETPSINENNNDNDFGFKDAIRELRRFFLDYPFLLEMGRQFSYAKDEERLDIFYQNLVKSRKA
ncbi:nucleic-acid-binding protein from transposon X-element [Trichonephila clavipes]|uniref:Nucleic-acid-binding protein from transposon X-element n=1 Tax=Trichonephila clavipes TaxID=2585209 RepID=A0A8X7B878_TRICX|nr:nucleic-acid-binding protein from transposon X-element [Trichonephila clavipes]